MRGHGVDAGTVMRIYVDKPCTNETVLAIINDKVLPQFLGLFRAAVLTWQGKDYASCWLEYAGRMMSYDENGDPFNPPFGVAMELFLDETL